MLPNHPPTDPLMLYMPLAVRLSNLGNILIFYYSMCNTLNRSGFSSSLLKKMEIVVGNTSVKGIAVVESRGDKSMHENFKALLIKVLTNVTKVFKS